MDSTEEDEDEEEDDEEEDSLTFEASLDSGDPLWFVDEGGTIGADEEFEGPDSVVFELLELSGLVVVGLGLLIALITTPSSSILTISPCVTSDLFEK